MSKTTGVAHALAHLLGDPKLRLDVDSYSVWGDYLVVFLRGSPNCEDTISLSQIQQTLNSIVIDRVL